VLWYKYFSKQSTNSFHGINWW